MPKLRTVTAEVEAAPVREPPLVLLRRNPRGGRGKRGQAGGRGRVEASRDAGLTSPIVGQGWPLDMWRGVGRGSNVGRESVQDKNRRTDAPSHGGGKL